MLVRKGRVVTAIGFLSVAMLGGAVWVKTSVWPVMDEIVSAKGLYRKVKSKPGEVCIERLHRSLVYGLNYYTRTPLPECEARPLPFRITQQDQGIPKIRVVE
jgi:hypothetical protein